MDNEEKQLLDETDAVAVDPLTEADEPVLRRMQGILVGRWAEVTMIVVLNAGMMVWLQYLAWEMGRQERSTLEKLSNAAGFFLVMGTMALGIVTQMLLLGFLASVVHEGMRRQEPTTLLLAGRYFFWRWIRSQILLGLLLIAGIVLCYEILNTIVFHVSSLQDIPTWAHLVSWTAPAVVMAKLVLILPAEMIVRNQMVLMSIQSIREYSLLQMKALTLTFIMGLGCGMWFSGLMPETGLAEIRGILVLFCLAIWASLGQFVTLLWAVLEVKDIRRPQKETIGSEPERQDMH